MQALSVDCCADNSGQLPLVDWLVPRWLILRFKLPTESPCAWIMRTALQFHLTPIYLHIKIVAVINQRAYLCDCRKGRRSLSVKDSLLSAAI